MRSKRVSVVASIMTGVVLVVLAGVTFLAMTAMGRANDQVVAARELVTPYLALQRAVAAEATAEAGYRRAPSETAWLRFEGAVREVEESTRQVRVLADPRDRAALLHLEHLNDRYVAAVRFSVGVRQPSSVEDTVAGPALDAMQDLLDVEIQRHRDEGFAAIQDQDEVAGQLSVVLFAAFLLAFLVLGLTWRSMLVAHRLLRVEATHHKERALTDSLTGLPNREALRISMDMALGRPKTRAALLFIDLDRFKPVNDTLGHRAGDLVLQEVAARLLGSLRAGEVAARIGGDEFAVFLPRGLAAPTVAQRILSELERPFLVEGREVCIGASIGVAHYPGAGHDHETMLRAADAAMYDAKQAGRGRVADAVPA